MPVAVADHGPAYMLALLVANSETFRTTVGAADVAAALTSIYYPWANEDEDEGDLELPDRAVIADDSDFGEEMHTKVATGVWQASGSFQLSFDFYVPSAEDTNRTNRWAWFQDVRKDILKEMRAIAGQGTSGVDSRSHFNLMSFSRVEGPWETLPGEEGLTDPSEGELKAYWHASYEMFWW